MSDRGDESGWHDLGPEPEPLAPELEERVRAAVRDLPPSRPDDAFRRRVKAQFLTGDLPRVLEDDAGHAEPALPASTARPRRLAKLPWAAALLAVFLGIWVVSSEPSQTPTWRLAGVRGGGTIAVDGRPVEAEGPDALEDLLVPGARLRVDDQVGVDLAVKGSVLMRLEPGTELVLPAADEWSVRERWSGELVAGEVLVATGPEFPGTVLTLTVPGGRVAVTGTAFALTRIPDGTCVCVLEGRVELTCDQGTTVPVESVGRRVVTRGSTVSEPLEIGPPERGKLEALLAEGWFEPR